MAKIIAGLASSHVPAIGAAIDNKQTEEPYWKRVFSGFEKTKQWMAETKPERLLLAGLDYSIQKFVVYVAAKPPRSIFRNVATRFGRTIMYIPIGQLSPVTMKKLRVVHVLDSYER